MKKIKLGKSINENLAVRYKHRPFARLWNNIHINFKINFQSNL